MLFHWRVKFIDIPDRGVLPLCARFANSGNLLASYDRGRSAHGHLMIVAWMLLAAPLILPGVWQMAVGRFVPTLILVMMLIDLGVCWQHMKINMVKIPRMP